MDSQTTAKFWLLSLVLVHINAVNKMYQLLLGLAVC